MAKPKSKTTKTKIKSSQLHNPIMEHIGPIIFVTIIIFLITLYIVSPKSFDTDKGYIVENMAESVCVEKHYNCHTIAASPDKKMIISVNTLEKLGVYIGYFPDDCPEDTLCVNSSAIDTGEKYLYVNAKNEYDLATREEIEELMDSGKLCMDGKMARKNMDKYTCVAFWPVEYAWNSSYHYLNEKKEYNEGFVVAMPNRIMSHDDFVGNFKGRGLVVIEGKIEWYEQHPEIKLYYISQVHDDYEIYGYSTKYGFAVKSKV